MVKQLEDVYQGASYEALLAKWGQMSDSHMTELVNACHVVVDALDIAADTIVAMKVEAIAELTVLAITFIADQAAAVATLGIAEAAEALSRGGQVLGGHQRWDEIMTRVGDGCIDPETPIRVDVFGGDENPRQGSSVYVTRPVFGS
ncbi:hypothetical protein ACIRPT_33635 [Streptomyces sp. NPDC101227]|uniref:hypothetical protein n=1 Tax=Streptomyces sp. NPDC101227 TaxID=3366136 RepID=UPI003827DA0B